MKRKKLAFEVEQKMSFQLALVVTISFSLATISQAVMTLSLSLSLSLSCGIICLKEDATLKQKKSWTKKFGGMMKFVICHLLLFLSLFLSFFLSLKHSLAEALTRIGEEIYRMRLLTIFLTLL